MKKTIKKNVRWIILLLAIVLVLLFFAFPEFFGGKISYVRNDEINKKSVQKEKLKTSNFPPLDKVAYDKKMLELANNPPDPIVYETIKTVETDANGKSTTKTTKVPLDPQPVKSHFWPVKAVYPNPGAILPFNRIIAYYGNLYSKKMGVLGEYPEAEMLQRLEVSKEMGGCRSGHSCHSSSSLYRGGGAGE